MRLFGIYLVCLLFLFVKQGKAAVYKVMLMGGSSVDCTYLPEKDRPHTKVKEKLKAAMPGMEFEVVNEGMGGEAIGPGAKTNLIEADVDGFHAYSRYDHVVEVNKNVDFIFLRYGSNDRYAYSVEVFKKNLKNLYEKLKKNYPGVKIAVETAIYDDPKHTIELNLNTDTKPFFDAIREFSKNEGCFLVDNYEALKEETEKGNWDLRIRRDKSVIDDSKDAEHANDKDLTWWSNNHPNAKGIDVIATKEAELVLKVLREEGKK
jgi:lysophospholipase L1-like esterase